MKTINSLKRIFGSVMDSTDKYSNEEDKEVECYWCTIDKFDEAEPDIAVCIMLTGEIEVRCFFGKWKKVFYSISDVIIFLKSEYK